MRPSRIPSRDFFTDSEMIMMITPKHINQRHSSYGEDISSELEVSDGHDSED